MLLLSDFEELTIGEIAQRLGEQPGAVKSRLYRARSCANTCSPRDRSVRPSVKPAPELYGEAAMKHIATPGSHPPLRKAMRARIRSLVLRPMVRQQDAVRPADAQHDFIAFLIPTPPPH